MQDVLELEAVNVLTGGSVELQPRFRVPHRKTRQDVETDKTSSGAGDDDLVDNSREDVMWTDVMRLHDRGGFAREMCSSQWAGVCFYLGVSQFCP